MSAPVNPSRPDARAAAGSSTAIECVGERLHLLTDRAIWWPAQQALLVADVHIGKSATFRALGVPVPSATDARTLERLAALVAATGAARLLVLGDLLHAAHAHEPAVLGPLERWRRQHAALETVLVRGNHDARAGDPPAVLNIQVVDEPLCVGPFALCHEPRASHVGYVLAGHLHPSVHLVGRADALRLACFWFGRHVGVLPAFGEFTGSLAIRPSAGDRVFGIADDRVIELPIA